MDMVPMQKQHLHYFRSVPVAEKALTFIASFPGNGGKRYFGIGKCPSSGFPSVYCDVEKRPRGTGGMSIDAMRGALRAWSRLSKKW